MRVSNQVQGLVCKLMENKTSYKDAGVDIDAGNELVELIKDVIPAPARRTGGNPAKRTFQALRIAVNNELQILEKAIPQAMAALMVGGRILVLSYHSLEDRIVKNAFKEQSSVIDALPGLPILLSKKKAPFELVNRKAEQACDAEIVSTLR